MRLFPRSTSLLSMLLLLLSALVLSVLAAHTALATDGVLEINQTCAVQTGCFLGDTAGYPVSITAAAGRSYRLTGDLIVPDENTTGILVSANDISIDLNNFAIIRSACVGTTVDCTAASGVGTGIDRSSNTLLGTSVKNGSITGMGSYGLKLGAQSEIVGLRIRWCQFEAIRVREGSTVSRNIVYQNGSTGIFAGLSSTITDNILYENGGNGIYTTGASTITGNTVYQNGANGIYALYGSTVSRNTVYRNGSVGIYAYDGSIVQHNAVRRNTGYGLNLGPTATYSENVITNNTGGTVTGGLNMLGNSCDGTTSCP